MKRNKCEKDFEDRFIGKSGLCIICYTNFLFSDPKMRKKAEYFAKHAGELSAEDLNRRFTI